MKKALFLVLVIIILVSFCGCNNTANILIPSNISYTRVKFFSDFKCDVSCNGQEYKTLCDDDAKQLYKLFINLSLSEADQDVSIEVDYVHLIFYRGNSQDDLTESNNYEYFGHYFVYSNGILQSTESPYMSMLYTYQVDTDLYDSICSLISQ